MKTKYVIVEIDQYRGILQIGFQSKDKIVLMVNFLIFDIGNKQTKIKNKFFNMGIAKLAIKRLEKHHEQMEKLI